MKSNILYNISRWVMAILFIFSGFTKAVNPFGFSVQLGEYFQAMGLDFLKPLAGLGGIVLPSLELLLGVMLALNLSRRIAAWGVMLFMVFFTCLTFWIALENPVNDCGCFGDVIKISNWGTFIKNIILLPFAVIIFINRNKGKSAKNILYSIAIPLSFVVAVYCYFNLPLIDATPYKIGTNIAEAMIIPIDAPQAESNTVLIYKNLQSGELKEFAVEDTEWHDESIWEYVDTKTSVISDGYMPKIKSLPMINSEGKDVAQEILATKGKLLLVVSNDLEKVDIKNLRRLSETYGRIVLLTSSPLDNNSVSNGIEIYNSDHTVISTMIQNHTGGALVLENGSIKKKYVMRQLAKK